MIHYRVGILLAVVLACTFGPASHADDFRIIGYLPTYRFDQATNGSIEKIDGVDDLIFFALAVGPGGELVFDSFDAAKFDQMDRMIKRHKQQNADGRCMICVGGWGKSDGFPAATAKPETRKRLAVTLAKFCDDHDLDGVDFDWEHPKNDQENANYASLIAATKAELGADRIVTIAMASWQPSSKALFENVDRVHLMSYDHAFPQATFDKSMKDVKAIVDAGCPKEKIALGVPFYGRNEANQAKTYAELIQANPDNSTKSIAPNQLDGYAFNGPEIIRKKLSWSRKNKLAGLMIWELGQDSQGESSLLKVIQE